MFEFLLRWLDIRDMSDVAKKRTKWGFVIFTLGFGTLFAAGTVFHARSVLDGLMLFGLSYVLALLIALPYMVLSLLFIYQIFLPLRRAWPAICAFFVAIPEFTRLAFAALRRAPAALRDFALGLPAAIRSIGWREVTTAGFFLVVGLIAGAWWPVAKAAASHLTWLIHWTFIGAVYIDVLLSCVSVLAVLAVFGLSMDYFNRRDR